MKIALNNQVFSPTPFNSEQELETAVVSNGLNIFGEKSIYIDIKKKVKSANTSFTNIPDGYVLDFRSNPKLWVIENELSNHNVFSHVGVQMLKFATQFSQGEFQVKDILFNAIQNDADLLKKANELVKGSSLSNLSEVLDYAVYKNEYGFVIIIDEITDDLRNVTRELARQPEILQISKYECNGSTAYFFDELLKELEEAKSSKVKEVRDIDTMVAPAREDGFKKVFIDQKMWHAVRISESVIPQIKYLAMYEVSPVSKIRWVGKVQSIKPWEDSGKYVLYLSEIFKVGPIKMDNQKNVPQGPRYTNFELIEKAKSLGDIF